MILFRALTRVVSFFTQFIFHDDSSSITNTDYYLLMSCIILTVLLFLQIKAFARPPPVPKKRLPKRPSISFLFKPDEYTTTSTFVATHNPTTTPTTTNPSKPITANMNNNITTSASSSVASGWKNPLKSLFSRSSSLDATTINTNTQQPQRNKQQQVDATDDEVASTGERWSVRSGLTPVEEADLDTTSVEGSHPPPTTTTTTGSNTTMGGEGTDTNYNPSQDLPDSFAPLLSSSQMEILRDQLTANLIHAIQVEGTVRIRGGMVHEIPLNKNTSRPQLRLDTIKSGGGGGTFKGGGCKLHFKANIGSDSYSYSEDLNVNNKTTDRSLPMVKSAGIAFDPPLPLSNVAPTLIHFPTLFEDKFVAQNLRRRHIMKMLLEFIISISSFIENILWIIEKYCQIHLSKVRVSPVYKGRETKASTTTTTTSRSVTTEEDDDPYSATPTTSTPEWRLSLAFSGHLMLFDWIPIPFISVVLPTFIIPQPHALLEYLLTPEPLASAKLRRENIAEQKIALAIINTAESWNVDTKAVVTPPVVGVDVTLSGGVSLAAEMTYGRDPVAGFHQQQQQQQNQNRSPDTILRDASLRDHSLRDRSLRANQQQQQRGGGGVASSSNNNNNNNANNELPDDLSSLSTPPHSTASTLNNTTTRGRNRSSFSATNGTIPPGYVLPNTTFDANELVPWYIEVVAKGSVSKEKMTFHLLKFLAKHEDKEVTIPMMSKLGSRGSFAIWTLDHRKRKHTPPRSTSSMNDSSTIKTTTTTNTTPGVAGTAAGAGAGAASTGALPPPAASPATKLRRKTQTSTISHLAALAAEDEEAPSVASILLYPDDTMHPALRMLNYDYAIEVFDDTRLDSITVSTGANHPMLNGGNMITTILESVYAFGSLSARQNAILDPLDWRQKRNILRHLPAIDFTFGVQNIFIPPESMSYSDDGNGNLCLPEMEGGRMMIRLLGGTEENNMSTFPTSGDASVGTGVGGVANAMSHVTNSTNNNGIHDSNNTIGNIHEMAPVSDGVKVIAEFGVTSLILNNEADVNEFPELDIFEGTKLKSLISGIITGSVVAHLKPQKLEAEALTTTGTAIATSTGPNIFNPLEAYEIEFSGSSFSLKIKECSANLGHRRIIIPTETTVMVEILESVVDMTLEGMTQCELCWDFQGSSPILQVAPVGQSPADVAPENKQQINFLIPPLRQGRFTFHVSSVGGINIAKAVTSREDKEGLYDWKFFSALVSPDHTSGDRLLQVVHDKRSMDKVLQVAKLINKDLHRIINFTLTQIWRAKEIFDSEGISDPKHIIPGHKMARLISLLLCGDLSETDNLVGIIQRVVAGEGLDVVKTKELLRHHVEVYDEWAPEIDRAVRWAAVAFGASSVDPPYVEADVPPLSQVKHHAARFRDIPSAKQLYERIHDKPHLPLEPAFSNLLSRLAPHLTFQQIEYFLKVRSPKDWQPSDLRRIRYVYSIKRRVFEIAESYGGLSFLPQSFLVSVFLGEATRASLRASSRQGTRRNQRRNMSSDVNNNQKSYSRITLSTLRRRRSTIHQRHLEELVEDSNEEFYLTPAGRVASYHNLRDMGGRGDNSRRDIIGGSSRVPQDVVLGRNDNNVGLSQKSHIQPYELGDSLLGPQDVAVLLQAGLTSAMKGSTVVQLNQRMLLDLMASQPKSFAIAVLAEIGAQGGHGSPRGLTSALMALLELDQTSFKHVYRLDMHALLETWLPELKIPKREDYMAGGRWARQSYYEAVYAVSTSIIEDAECYMALKSHIQQNRRNAETDPLPQPRVVDHDRDSELSLADTAGMNYLDQSEWDETKLRESVAFAKQAIANADKAGETFVQQKLLRNEKSAKESASYETVIQLYRDAFDACARLISLDKLAFHSEWFKDFYKRNYDALMIKSMLDNVIDDVDKVRYWLQKVRIGGKRAEILEKRSRSIDSHDEGFNLFGIQIGGGGENYEEMLESLKNDKLFLEPQKSSEQELVDAIIDATIFNQEDRERLRKDPLVRLLIPNVPGHYNFAIVTAMGVITEGKQGSELETALTRLKNERGVVTVRADTGTARSLDYNASKIQDAIDTVVKMKKPYGLIGYSQGCANALWAESVLLSGSPAQRKGLENEHGGLVCRQLLFSAANGSVHGPALERKVHRLIVMCEEFFKYQQGYVSRALASTVLETLNSAMDSAPFQKAMGGAQSFLSEGCRAFWREAQHLPHVPTCTLRGVMEEHTTPECLEMLGNQLAKQSGSKLHDSQVHACDAVGYPVYHINRNGRLLKTCHIGDGAIQRTHHWSPLCEEVDFVCTPKDVEQASFDCAKDRHVYPWVDVNVRFGFIKYAEEDSNWEDTKSDITFGSPLSEQHPSKLARQYRNA